MLSGCAPIGRAEAPRALTDSIRSVVVRSRKLLCNNFWKVSDVYLAQKQHRELKQV